MNGPGSGYPACKPKRPRWARQRHPGWLHNTVVIMSLCVYVVVRVCAGLKKLRNGIAFLWDSRNDANGPVTGRWRGNSMVYVQRDEHGRLLRVDYQPFEGMTDNLAVESDELKAWLDAKEEVRARLASLHSSDLELIRVLEDVVSVLVERGVIQYTDLPEAARIKLDQRAVARAEIEGLSSILGGDTSN